MSIIKEINNNLVLKSMVKQFSINRLTSLLSIASASKALNMAACENSGSLRFLFTSVLLFTSVFLIYLRLAFFVCVVLFCLRVCFKFLSHLRFPFHGTAVVRAFIILCRYIDHVCRKVESYQYISAKPILQGVTMRQQNLSQRYVNPKNRTIY